MENKFPELKNISIVRRALESLEKDERKAFYEKEIDGTIIFNYRFYHKNTFPNPKSYKGEESENKKILREVNKK
jgi:hypothetical protein